MAAGTVSVLQAVAGDRLIDNETVTVGGQTVYRQRVQIHGPLMESRFDYDARTDKLPVYTGEAEPGTLTSSATWTVRKFTYDSSNRTTRIQVQQNIAWDNRATGWGA